MDQGLCDRTPTSVILRRTAAAKRSPALSVEGVGDVPGAIWTLGEVRRRGRRCRVLVGARGVGGRRRGLLRLLSILLMLDLGVVGVGRSCCVRT